jgi:DNA repair ATPase RecN
MAFKRRAEPTTIEEEREALRAQHAALEDLKQQLAERIGAVREREVELHHALADAGSSEPRAAATVVHRQAGANADADTDENALEAAQREKELVEREQAVTKREALLDARSRELELAVAATATVGPAPDPDAERLAQIELRLTELRDAEKLFLRTRDELAARSEAVAARERLVSQRERELDEREDEAGIDRAGGPEFTEMEARLRRLEQSQQDPREQTHGFSGGLKKLEQGTRQQRPG